MNGLTRLLVTRHALGSDDAERDVAPGSIGVLTRPADLVAWEKRVRTRFQFLAALDENERRWAICDKRHRREVEAAFADLAQT